MAYKGKIITKRLDYDGQKKYIPVSGVLFGDDGKVHIWGRNDSPTDEKLGISWIVMGPDGKTVQNYYDWASGATDPGDDHEFIGGKINFTQVGTYKIAVILYVNSVKYDVDSYYGNLCTVVVAEEEEEPEKVIYSGLITRVYPEEIEAGKPLNLYVDFQARTSSLWQSLNGWRTDIDITLDGLKSHDSQLHMGADGSRQGEECKLGTMPSRNVSGKVVLSSGDTGEVLHTKNITIKYLPPGVEPAESEYSGAITKVTPTKCEVGKTLIMKVSYGAYCTSAWQSFNGWRTDVDIILDGLRGHNSALHMGADGSRQDEDIKMGTMPNRTLRGKVKLIAQDIDLVLDTWDITVAPVAAPVPEPEPDEGIGIIPPAEGEFADWMPMILLGVAAVILLMPGEEKKPLPPSRQITGPREKSKV